MAVYETIHKIEIDGIDVSKIIGVEINKNINNFTNTCKITLSKFIRYKNKRIFSTIDSFIFKPKQIVKIRLGYRNGFQTNYDKVFEGFISNINLEGQNTAVIEAEDYMYFLKQSKFNITERNITLKKIGQTIIKEVNKQIPSGVDKIDLAVGATELNLHKFKAEEATGVQVLQLLQKYTLQSYFEDNKLVIGANYSSQETNKEIGKGRDNFVFSEYNRELLIKNKINPLPNLIVDKKSLKFQRSEDVKINITANIINRKGEVIKKIYGDKEGEARTFYFYGDYKEKEIEDLVANQVKRLKYTGFKQGSTFTVFGLNRTTERNIASIKPLDAVSFDGIGNVGFSNQSHINDNRNDIYEKSTYIVVSVKTLYNQSGYRQIVELQNKISVDGDVDSIVKIIEKSLLKIEEEDSEIAIEKQGKTQS